MVYSYQKDKGMVNVYLENKGMVWLLNFIYDDIMK